MNSLEIVKLKVAIENFLNDKCTIDDVNILKDNGFIRYVPENSKLVIVYPEKSDMKDVLNDIKNKFNI